MGKIKTGEHKLKYFPIDLMYVQSKGLYAYTFIEPITLQPYDAFEDAMRYHLRRLRLKVQRHFRKELRDMGGLIENHYLAISNDETFITDSFDGAYLTCTLELVPKTEMDSKDE